MARITGTYDRKTVGGEEIAAFIPHALPPADPPLQLDTQANERLRAAEHAASIHSEPSGGGSGRGRSAIGMRWRDLFRSDTVTIRSSSAPTV